MSGVRAPDGLLDAWMTVLYALAAHFLEELDFMPALMFIGQTDTGKAIALRQLESMCKAPGFQGGVLVQWISGTSPLFRL